MGNYWNKQMTIPSEYISNGPLLQFCKVVQGDATQVHDRWGGDIIYHISRYSLVCQVLLTLKSTN
jgi:hypothetical protein